MILSHNKLRFLEGGGEMGELTRSKDWALTSLGPTEAWPQSLKTMLGVILNSRFPMFLWWGPDLICFYNDAYRPSLGQNGKHPDILGMNAKDAWPEIWEIIKPLIDQVLQGGESTWSEDQLIPIYRNGKLEDVYWTFSYSPVLDESGEVGGVLVTCMETTEKLKANKKLAEGEQLFRNAADNAPVLIWMSGEDRRSNFFNTEWLQFTGRTMEQETGDGWMEGIHPDDRAECDEVFNTAFDHRIPFYIEYRLRRRDGEYRWISDKGVPRFASDGTFEGYIGASLEIHDKILHEKKLKEDEEKLNIIIEASELGTWELNVKTRAVNYSARYIEIFGYTQGTKLNHEQLLKHLHPDDMDVRTAAFAQAFETGLLQYQSRLVWNDGSIHWIEGKGKVFYDEQHQPLKLVGTVRDITSEKTFYEELEEKVKKRTEQLEVLNESLQKSEERYHMMVEEVEDYAILYINREGTVENWNKGAEKIKGYKAEEIIGKNFSSFYTESDKATNLPQFLINQAITNGRARQEGWRVRKDGSKFWASVTITAVHNKQGEVIGFSKVTHDLTEKKKADDRLKRYASEQKEKNNELEKMNKELQSFAYISSHDLQEPLRKIQTFASRIVEKEYDNLSDSGRESFLRMQNAAGRMQMLIEDLLAYSRTSTSEREFEIVHLNEVVDQVREELKEELQHHQAILETTGLCELRIIPFQFRQLLHNLISNSLKFATPGKAPLIKMSCSIGLGSQFSPTHLSPTMKYCHIHVEDNGIGFEPQYGEKIFELFQRLHGKEQYNGTGIGLAIVKKIVENHNGFITASGAPGKGAAFDIYIPVV